MPAKVSTSTGTVYHEMFTKMNRTQFSISSTDTCSSSSGYSASFALSGLPATDLATRAVQSFMLVVFLRGNISFSMNWGGGIYPKP